MLSFDVIDTQTYRKMAIISQWCTNCVYILKYS